MVLLSSALPPPLQAPLIKGSDSFCESQGYVAASPSESHMSMLKTPRLPPEAPQRPVRFFSGGSACHSTGHDSELSGAATFNKSMRHLQLSNEVDSPRPGPKSSDAPRERQVPSCPQKEGSRAAQRRHALVTDTGDDEPIIPRTLDLNPVDDVNSLSLSPLKFSSPGGVANSSMQPSPTDDWLDLRGKRHRSVLAETASGPDLKRTNSIPPPAIEPPLRTMNSLVDRKLLFNRQDSEYDFKFDEHFVWGHRIGSGSYSEVYAVRHKSNGEAFAIKRSKRALHSKSQRAEYLREVTLANNMPEHPHVAQYYRAWQDSNYFYVQMELCEGGTLRHLMEAEKAALMSLESELRVWEIVRHVSRGLQHIHVHAVMHCDLKPDNILISRDGSFKIGDLGQAIAIKAWDDQEGDACYLSRDLLESRPSAAADIFSFGIMIYEVKSGCELPGSGDEWDFLRSGNVPPPPTCGLELATLIHESMDPRPEARPTANSIFLKCITLAMSNAQSRGGAACAEPTIMES
mmetsp:Transcript_44862/g.93508  ORF Transcript_44862/g.93508 Transcript_44862/m.93508 type:complete len:517 (+) Transcript_44862:40-1590(+)